MPELSEMIRDYVDSTAPHVAIEDVWARTSRGDAASRTRRSRPHLAVGLATTAAAIAVALVAVLLIVPIGSAQSSAATTLNNAALVAASRPNGPTPGAHEYLYYEVTSGSVQSTPAPVGQSGVLYRYTETMDTWVAPDGSGRQRITYAPDSLVVPSQRAAWDAPHARPIGPGPSDTTFPTTFAGTFPVGGPIVNPNASRSSYLLSYPNTAKFPTQPAALERAIKRQFGVQGGSTPIFFLVGDALQVGASPALRAALFKLVEQLPGVTLLGRTKDASGRVGVGVALSTPRIRDILVFNPHTSAVLGELTMTIAKTSVLGTEVPNGTVIDFTTYGTTGVTASLTRLPDGSQVPLTAVANTTENGRGPSSGQR